MFCFNDGRRMEPRREKPKGSKGMLVKLRAEKGEQTDGGRGGRNRHTAQGFRGQEGHWGLGQGWQDREQRDGRWSPAGVDVCPGGQAIQDRKRRVRRVCKRAV